MNQFRRALTGALIVGAAALRGADGSAPKTDLRTAPRVYVAVSESWSAGGWSPWWGLAGGIGGGARPQTAEITKSFVKNCPSAVPTLDRENADFVLLMEHEGGKSVFRKDTKYAVYNRTGDHVASGSTRMVGTAARKACEAVTRAQTVSPHSDRGVGSSVE